MNGAEISMRTIAPIAIVLLAGVLAGCQTAGRTVDGRWASDDGVFVATFSNGAFTSRLTDTGDVVAEGRYMRAADGLQLTWLSIVTGEQRSAVCRFQEPGRLACQPRNAAPFSMTRVA